LESGSSSTARCRSSSCITGPHRVMLVRVTNIAGEMTYLEYGKDVE
jgi:hypothetical protein